MTDTTVRLADPEGYLQELRLAVDGKYIGLLRKYFDDYKEKNTLIKFIANDPSRTGQEFTDEDYLIGIADAVASMNSTEPIDQVFGPLSPIPLDLFLGFGRVAMLEMSMRRRAANELMYSAEGTSVDTQKFNQFKGLMESERNFFTDKLKRYKRGLNLADAYGGLPTSYSWAYVVLR
jgi:hypothetical protein